MDVNTKRGMARCSGLDPAQESWFPAEATWSTQGGCAAKGSLSVRLWCWSEILSLHQHPHNDMFVGYAAAAWDEWRASSLVREGGRWISGEGLCPLLPQVAHYEPLRLLPPLEPLDVVGFHLGTGAGTR